MATPVASSYTVAAGQPIFAGRPRVGFGVGATLGVLLAGGSLVPNASAFSAVAALGAVAASGSLQGYVLPAWLSGKAVHEWVEIAGTSGAGGATIDAYSGFAVTSDGKLIVLAAGGHGDSSDNRVVSLDLTAGAPSWSTLQAASSSVQPDVTRYADGKPTSRHTYTNTFHVASMNRVFSVGCTYAYGAGNNYAANDAFRLSDNQWDNAGTYLGIPEGDGSGKAGAAMEPGGAAIWTNTLRKFVPSTNTWTNPITTRTTGTDAPFPMAYDSTRGQLFGINARTGTLVASRTPVAGSQEFDVTFNASSAYTQFLADKLWYSGMDYDPDGDRFLVYAGQTFDATGAVLTNVPGRVYVITPNATNVWDMSLLTLTGTAPGNPPASGSGINGRFRYVAALKGFVLLPQRTSNLFFFKVA